MKRTDIERLLHSPDENHRRQATLVIIKSPSLEGLVKLQAMAEFDESVEVRFYARKAIDIIKKNWSRDSAGVPEPQGGRPAGNEDEKINTIEKIISAGARDSKIILKKLLGSENDLKTVTYLIKAIGKSGDESDIDTLTPYLSHENSRIRANAVEALEMLGSVKAFPHILEMIGDGDNRVRANAVKAANSLGKINIFRIVSEMAHSARPSFQAAAAYLLRLFPSDESAEILSSLLKCGNAGTTIKAAAALEHFRSVGVKKAEKELADYTGKKKPVESGESFETVFDEIESSTRAKNELVRGLADCDAKKRVAAVSRAMAGTGFGIEKILHSRLAVEKDFTVESAILHALGLLCYQKAVPDFEARLKSPDPRCRANAAEAVRLVRSHESLDLLLPLLSDENGRVVANAAIAVRELSTLKKCEKKYESAISKALFNLASSGVPSLQRSAFYALVEISRTFGLPEGCFSAVEKLKSSNVAEISEKARELPEFAGK